MDLEQQNEKNSSDDGEWSEEDNLLLSHVQKQCIPENDLEVRMSANIKTLSYRTHNLSLL